MKRILLIPFIFCLAFQAMTLLSDGSSDTTKAKCWTTFGNTKVAESM